MSRMTPLVRTFVQHGKVAECPIIDMHTHTDQFNGIYFPHPDPAGIIATMDRCGVQLLVTAPHIALSDPITGNAAMLNLLAAYPTRLRGYWYYNPNYPQLLEEAFAQPLQTPGVFGYKIHPGWAEQAITAEGYQPLFAWADTHHLPVLSHTWRGEQCGVAGCRQIAEKYPNVRLILGHSCWDDWAGAIALANDFPNVYLEITAAERMPGYIDRAVHEAGASKILFGTDLPWFNPQFTLGCVLFADIDDDDRHAILHRNAERLLAERGMS